MYVGNRQQFRLKYDNNFKIISVKNFRLKHKYYQIISIFNNHSQFDINIIHLSYLLNHFHRYNFQLS